MGRLGFSEILVILVIALLLFGAGRIADIGKGLGEGIKNFKKGMRDDEQPPAAKLPESASQTSAVVDASAKDEKTA